MNTHKWLCALPQFLVLLPAAASCYLPARNQMKYPPLKTAALCLAVLLPCSFSGAWLCITLRTDANRFLLPALVLFFFLYRRTVKLNLSRCLAIYIGVCAIQTFPGQFAYALDAYLHPLSGADSLSTEAALFQLALACLLPIAFAYPARRQFAWAIDHLDFPKLWYSTVVLSVIFLMFNVLAVPRSYSTLHTGRLIYLFPLLEGCALMVLIAIYVMFYQAARLLLEQAQLQERSQLLEMQARQYQTLQEYVRHTSQLRHDFRHHLRLLSALVEKGEFGSIAIYLAEYEESLAEGVSANYCANAALNALFGYYHEMAALAGVETDWKIDLPQPLTVSELDLAALFGNLMENAISGCKTLPEDQRYFGLTSQIRHQNTLYVVSTNSFDGKVKKGKDGYYSTSHSGKGTGLASITAVAEKYQGTAQFSNSDREFYADVMLRI